MAARFLCWQTTTNAMHICIPRHQWLADANPSTRSAYNERHIIICVLVFLHSLLAGGSRAHHRVLIARWCRTLRVFCQCWRSWDALRWWKMGIKERRVFHRGIRFFILSYVPKLTGPLSLTVSHVRAGEFTGFWVGGLWVVKALCLLFSHYLSSARVARWWAIFFVGLPADVNGMAEVVY